MKNYLLLFFVTISITVVSKAQQLPKLIKTENEDMFETNTWAYKNYLFVASTPQIARPYTSTQVFKKINGKRKEIMKAELFNATFADWINKKLEEQYYIDKKEMPSCYPNDYSYLNINDLEITVDKNNFYFEYSWNDNHEDQLSGKTTCELVYSTTNVTIPINQIDKFLNK